MDNSEKIINYSGDPPGEGPWPNVDPILQARDESGRPNGKMQPTQIVPNPQRVVGGPLLPSQILGTTGPRQAAPSAYDIAEQVLRFKWTALVVFILTTAPMLAAIWTQVIPVYQAKAEIRIRPIIPFVVFKTEDAGMLPLYSSFVNTQVSIIRSPAVLQRVLDQQDVQATQWYKNPQMSFRQRLSGYKPTPMEQFLGNLSAKPRRGTEILDIRFVATSTNDAKTILSAVIEQYVQHVGLMLNEDQDKVYRELIEQYEFLEKEIQGREKVAAELRKTLGTGTPEKLVANQRIRLDEARANLDHVQQRIALLEWELKQTKPADSNHAPGTAAGDLTKQVKYHQDAEWCRLDLNVRTLRHNIDNSILTDKHPDAIRVQKDLVFAEDLLRRREAQLDEQERERLRYKAGLSVTIADSNNSSFGRPLLSPEHQLSKARKEEQLLDAEVKRQEQAFQELFASAQLLEKENNELAHKRELFDAIRRRRDQKNMERGVFGRVELLTEAQAPSQPYNDRRMVFTAMALCMGLGMGAGTAFLRTYRSKAIYAPKDMPYITQVPFLGYIPEIHAKKPPDGEASHALVESIRVVRTALLSRLDGQYGTTILVTSAGAGTGKSSFTLMLGKSLAQARMKVLMIDADFRKMTLTKHFENLSDQPGFIQSLRRRSVDNRHIFKTDTPGLSIVPAGKRDDDELVLEVVVNGAFHACIDKFRQQYDVILLDSPPILPLADATILSRQVDGAILVERERISSRVNVNSALERLRAAGGRLLGTVFIGSSSHDRYGYGYGYYRRAREK